MSYLTYFWAQALLGAMLLTPEITDVRVQISRSIFLSKIAKAMKSVSAS